MQTPVNMKNDVVRRTIEKELCEIADEIGAALFLCGSQFYAGQGEDFDFRMVLPSPTDGLVLLRELLPGARRLLPHAFRLKPNTIGLKFERLGELISVQIHSTEFIRKVCALKPVIATILRTTTTSHSNEVFGFERPFKTPQPHSHVGRGAWLVTIDQDPKQHDSFSTQIYHNMVMGSCTLRDRHGFNNVRRQLLYNVALESHRHGQPPRSGFMRLMWRNQDKWSPSVRKQFFTDIHTAVRSADEMLNMTSPGADDARASLRRFESGRCCKLFVCTSTPGSVGLSENGTSRQSPSETERE